MVVRLRRDPATKVGALERVIEQLGMYPMTLRKCAKPTVQVRSPHAERS
jgi:hypothetical protein